MYKLENDVQWTDELKSAFKHNVTRAKILYNNVEINENNHLKDLTLDEKYYISNLGFVGAATAKKVEINLLETDEDLNLENQEIEVKIGADYNGDTYYINYGKFIVNKPPENDETSGTIRVVAYDYMIKFNKPYIDRVIYPCSLLTLLQDICNQAGVILGNTNFANKDFIVENNQFEGNTLREVLQQIAKCAFSWARIGQDNKLYLDFNVVPETTETITINDYKANAFKKANEYYGPVNQVTYADSYIEGQEEKVKDQESIDEYGLKELVIYDNLFAYTAEKRSSLIQAGTRLFGLTYMPISELELIGLAYLDCRDAIAVETLAEETFTSRVFSHQIRYNGTLHDSIVTEGSSDNEEAYKNTATTVFQNQQTQIKVDKANKTIQLLAGEVTEQNNKIADLEITTEGIEAEVSNIYKTTKTVSGNRQIVLENCVKGYLLKLRIKGNNDVFDRLYPADDLYPSDTLYPRGDSRIVVTDGNGNSMVYDLRVSEVLRANDEVYDEYILEDNFAKVIRRVNPDGTTKINEEVENIGTYTIYVSQGTNTITIKNYSASIEAVYVEQNAYTDQFATKIEMSSAITQTAEEINTEVRKKVGENEIISKINQTAEEVSIDANKININGVISANGNFEVDEEGNMLCKNGTFSGDIYTSNNGKLASASQGVMSTLFATSNGPLTSYDYLGYLVDMSGQKLQRSSPFVSVYIPDNFTPVYAYLIMEQTQPYFITNAGNTYGRAYDIKVRKGAYSPSFTLQGFVGEYTMTMSEISGTDITNTAYGSSTITPNVGMTVSNNIANQLSKGSLNVISAYTNNSTYDNVPVTYQGTEQLNAGSITGLVKLSLQIIGYLNPY